MSRRMSCYGSYERLKNSVVGRGRRALVLRCSPETSSAIRSATDGATACSPSRIAVTFDASSLHSYFTVGYLTSPTSAVLIWHLPTSSRALLVRDWEFHLRNLLLGGM